MKNSRKIILVMLSIMGLIALLVGSIAYYRIVVEGNIKGSTGNAVFVLRDSDNSVWNNNEINLGKVNPGDSGEFTVTMDASGSTVDMYATLEIERTNLPTNLKFYTTSDHKSELHKYYSFLKHSGIKSETLTIYWYWNPYIDDIEDSKFINKESIEANIRVSAVQISEYAYMKNGNGVTSSDRMYFWKDNYRPYIRTITFGNDLSNLPSSCTEENLCWDISNNTTQKKKVYGYLIDSGLTVSETDSSTSTTTEKPLYNLYIVSEAPIFAPTNCGYIFYNFKNLTQMNFNNNFNTSKVTSMGGMFKNCKSLTSLDLSNFNTPNVTTFEIGGSGMFAYCSSLTSLDLSNFNTSNVTDMGNMFLDCSSLTNLDLSNFNTSNVTDMGGMFRECSSLTSLDLSSFNTSKVAEIPWMFGDCSSLTILNLCSFNTSNVTSMLQMFYNCSSLTSLDISNFNTSKVTNMYGMFWICSSLTSLDLSNFNTSSVADMTHMFHGCSSLTNLDLSNFNTSNVANMYRMFSGCSKFQTTINIMNANITDYTGMFSGAATDPNAKITVNYIAALDTIADGQTQSLIDKMIATKSSNSNVVKGSQI